MRLWFLGVDCVSEGMRLARNRRAAAEGTDERGAAVLHAVLAGRGHGRGAGGFGSMLYVVRFA